MSEEKKLNGELDDSVLDMVSGGVDGQENEFDHSHSKKKPNLNQKNLDILEQNCRAPLILPKN